MTTKYQLRVTHGTPTALTSLTLSRTYEQLHPWIGQAGIDQLCAGFPIVTYEPIGRVEETIELLGSHEEPTLF